MGWFLEELFIRSGFLKAFAFLEDSSCSSSFEMEQRLGAQLWRQSKLRALFNRRVTRRLDGTESEHRPTNPHLAGSNLGQDACSLMKARCREGTVLTGVSAVRRKIPTWSKSVLGPSQGILKQLFVHTDEG